jgi:hydrogenase maturation protease
LKERGYGDERQDLYVAIRKVKTKMTLEITDINETLREILTGSVAFLGIGNSDRGDDGAGIALALLLKQAGVPHVFEGGKEPERLVPLLRDGAFDTVVFLDAVEAGLEPGAAVILDREQMRDRFPQVSTHKLSLASLAGLVAEAAARRIWLIGIQAGSIDLGAAGLEQPVGVVVRALAQGIAGVVKHTSTANREPVCT